ncbi:hypothetical protein JTE90_008971 [Oedothorax gibbosus]|uniref:Uncharacterized protein n=1 Tax=Oedothorax gibbosus TaxID=931172 RepID=A0AAV6UJH7_9ARAC|nr:hypothetical protein JTE90_008971 [Oedothorax gibbosus]
MILTGICSIKEICGSHALQSIINSGRKPPAAKPDEALFALIALTRPWPPPFVRPPFSGTAGSPATYSVIVNASAVDSCASVAAPLYTVVQTRPWPPAFVRPPFGSLSAVQTRPWPPAFVRPPFGSLSAVQTRPLPPERFSRLPFHTGCLLPSNSDECAASTTPAKERAAAGHPLPTVSFL